MSKVIIEKLQESIQKEEMDLSLLNSMKEIVIPYAAKGEEDSSAIGVPIYIQNLINQTKKTIKGLKQELSFQLNATSDKHIEVMFFKAGHRGFDSDEITKMLIDFRKFKDVPVEKEINFGMSDEVKMFLSIDVDTKEAQRMWEYFLKNSFNGNDDCLMEYGDLLIWNGRDFVDGDGKPFAGR